MNKNDGQTTTGTIDRQRLDGQSCDGRARAEPGQWTRSDQARGFGMFRMWQGCFLRGCLQPHPITVIVESGGGGGTSWRMTEWFSHGAGQSEWSCNDRPQRIDVLEDNGICGPWVTSAARSFRDNPATVNNLPFDQHMLLATIAPRYLVHFTNSNFSWCWLAGTSEALASWRHTRSTMPSACQKTIPSRSTTGGTAAWATRASPPPCSTERSTAT